VYVASIRVFSTSRLLKNKIRDFYFDSYFRTFTATPSPGSTIRITPLVEVASSP
jgi:hypothetical protein